jgi:hypothetical protein
MCDTLFKPVVLKKFSLRPWHRDLLHSGSARRLATVVFSKTPPAPQRQNKFSIAYLIVRKIMVWDEGGEKV